MAAGNRRQSRHLRWAKFLFAVDFLLVWFSFVIGVWVRFAQISLEKILEYGPGISAASIALPVIFYIGGLYSERHLKGGWIVTFRWLLFGFLGVLISALTIGSLDFSSRIGRGVLVAAFPFIVSGVLLRHTLLMRRVRKRLDTFFCLVTSKQDETAAVLLNRLWGPQAQLRGIVTAGGYSSESDLPLVGTIHQMFSERSLMDAEVILVKDRHLAEPDVASVLRKLRYEGIEILSLVDACEEAFQAVPLPLITDGWLFRASNQSGLFYIRKLKRLFDIVFASIFMVLLSPFLAIGVIAVKISSSGPVLFRQVRAGKLERPITVMKLRTMHVHAEGDGSRWAEKEDPRIFPVGRILRKFRVDEIPQLINVLKGDISFVGPRPEQLTLIDQLDADIPFYRERLLIQPGLTGWAQVRFPYGASVADAAQKLEYDLYYMKHMGLLFDFFILLETVKVILCGGVRKGGDRDYLQFRDEMESLHKNEDV